MAAWHEDDIDVMLSGLGGVPVVHGSETGLGLPEAIDEHVLQGLDASQTMQISTVTVRTSAFQTLKNGDVITVDGVSCRVHDRLKIDDGALSKLLIRGL